MKIRQRRLLSSYSRIELITVEEHACELRLYYA
jgi:hypothetical protein